MELRSLSPEELSRYLEGRAPELRELLPAEREAVVRMAERLVDRELAPRFVLTAVQNTIAVLRSAGDVGSASPLPEEIDAEAAAAARRLTARRLADTTRALIREARAARRSNEVKRMRGVLNGVDRGALRQSLGDEGERLCREIDVILDRLMHPVRRGRPRTQRLAA